MYNIVYYTVVTGYVVEETTMRRDNGILVISL